MKKIILFNSFAVIIFLLLFFNIDDLRAYSTGWIVLPMLVPIFAGAITVFKQDKEKSYAYLPLIIVGFIFFGLVSVVFYKLFSYFVGDFNKYPFMSIGRLYRGGPDLSLVLCVMYVLGALLGIAISGVRQVFLPKWKFRFNFEISSLKSFIIGAIFLLVANVYYVFLSTPPDSRWKLEILITSLVIILYLVVFFIVNKKMLKNFEKNHLPLAYNVFLSLFFISNATTIRVAFQYVNSFYFRYIALSPYLIIFGLGILCYVFLILYVKKSKMGDVKI